MEPTDFEHVGFISDAGITQEPHVGTLAYECKFTVESRHDGDFERNLGGPYKRVTFEGYASAELMSTIADAAWKVVSE